MLPVDAKIISDIYHPDSDTVRMGNGCPISFNLIIHCRLYELDFRLYRRRTFTLEMLFIPSKVLERY